MDHLSVQQKKRLGAFFVATDNGSLTEGGCHTSSSGKKKRKKERIKKRRGDDTPTHYEETTAEESSSIAVASHRPGKKKLRKLRYLQKHLVAIDFLFEIAQSCDFTGSVRTQATTQPFSSVKVFTCCAPVASVPHRLTPSIQVQPLLVLDLNGILCHRFRAPTPFAPSAYRPVIAKIAGTPIIPRPELDDFLQFLNSHFCLAVWTSAKDKNARALAKALIPANVNLLFVWAQKDCDAVQEENELVYEKNLQRVWQQYPLWTSHTTLLMDDSPQKCRQWHQNAIHPPSMHGLGEEFVQEFNRDNKLPGSDKSLLSDQDNAAAQRSFFEGLVERWSRRKSVVTTEWSGDSGQVKSDPPFLINHLQQHAVGHMGWG